MSLKFIADNRQTAGPGELIEFCSGLRGHVQGDS